MRNGFYILLLLILQSCGINKSLHNQPQLQGYDASVPITTKHNAGYFSSGKSSLVKNAQGLWELRVFGDALQLGLQTGSLEDSLFKKQERVFFAKVQDLIPGESKQKWLRKMLNLYNRKLYQYVPEEYKTEMYGLSRYGAPEFNGIAQPYLRTMYLHAAHDIGHAMQDLMLVGCSSFAAWGDKSSDGKLILGRNLDFYAGDDFAQDKVVSIVTPTQGIPFVSVSWPGMIGVVSGMNREGLSVTINAAKSKIPWSAKTPISIVTREILQYATTIEEAVAIARRRPVFVSESIMVGSAKDGYAAIIEVSPHKMDVYRVPNSNNQLLCSNHFQSPALKDDKRNQFQIENSHSGYRYEKLEQEFRQHPKIDPVVAAEILRDTKGLDDKSIGYGNERALNQLLAHHGVIFKPEDRLVWVSANPYQLGTFVCYDLNTIFEADVVNGISVSSSDKNIGPDPFLQTQAYRDYEEFRKQDRVMDAFLKQKSGLTPEFLSHYQALNPDLWSVYAKPGLYYFNRKQYDQAKIQIEQALQKEVTTLPERRDLETKLRKINRKLR